MALAAGLQAMAPNPEVELAQLNTSLWVSLSNAPQQRPDINQLARLFESEAIVAGGRSSGGAINLNISSANDFIASQDRVKPYGFYECEVAREVRLQGHFATVLSIVESRRDPHSEAPDFTGLNSVQWAYTDNGWKIVSLYYNIPAAGESIDLFTYQTGKCLDGYE